MGGFSKLFGNRNAVLDENIRRIKQNLFDEGKNQANQLNVDIAAEAKKLGYDNAILKEGMKEDPVYFLSVAYSLLNYPPELGFLIATELKSFESSLGWNPVIYIFFAVVKNSLLYSNLSRLFSPKIFRKMSEISAKQLMNDPFVKQIMQRSDVIQRSGQLLAVVVLSLGNSVEEARIMYNAFGEEITDDASVRKALNDELSKYDKEIAQKIIRG